MTTEEAKPLESAAWSQFFRFVAIAVLVAGGLVVAIESATSYQRIQEEFLSRAQAIFHTVRLFRQWNAEHGGVFVPVRPGISANPHLKDPDIHTADGRHFTLRNPAIMTREVSELALGDPASPVAFRVTSLKLKNPGNAPDAWERMALESISQQKSREQYAVVAAGERQTYRYLAPLYIEQSCLRCHDDQGYQVGDLRGGISVSFDVTTPLTTFRQQALIRGGLLMGTFFGLLALVWWMTQRLNRQIMLANQRSMAAESEHRTLIRAVEQSPVSISITDPQGIIEYINPRFTRETGFSAIEAIGQTMQIVRSGQTPPETYLELWQTITSKRDWRGDLLNRRKDGTLIWEEVSISPVLDTNGDIAHFIAVKEDITERKARRDALSRHNLVLEQEAQLRIRDLVTALAAAETAEQELRDSQSFVQGILDSVDSQIAVIDEHGTIVAINDAWRRFSLENSTHPGQLASNTDVGANYLSICVAANSEDNDEGLATRDGIQAVLEGREQTFQFEYPCHSPTEQRWFTMTVTPLGQNRRGAVVVHTNITTRKLQEARIEQLNRTLEQRVREVEAADQAKDAFLANMSHEIRTPLNAIIGLTHMAEHGSQTAEQRELLKKIGIAGGSLLGIVNSVLDLSKIAAGRMDLEAAPFPMAAVIGRLKSLHEHTAEHKGITLTFEVASDVPAAFTGDALRLGQILDNLVANALKFTAQGEVSIQIRLRSPVTDGMADMEFLVEDTGIGMSAAEIDILFQPFVQADASITRKFGGTGLGLAICQRLTEAMGGQLTVTSTVGEGSCFHLRLTLPVTELTPADHHAAVAGHRGNTLHFVDLRVLVVDDQPLNQMITKDLLERRGVKVTLADHGKQALDVLGNHPPDYFDAVLMDIQMPVMDGLTATQTLRTNPAYARLPVIAMTAHNLDHERKRYREAGMVDHLGKPFVPADLYAVLARWTSPEKQREEPKQRELLQHDAVAAAPVAIEGLDMEAGLSRFGGDRGRYHGWLNRFVAESPEVVARIESHLCGPQPAVALKEIHAFKGQAGMLGLTDLHAATARLEDALRTDQPADPAAWRACHQETMGKITRWLQQVTPN